MFKKSLIAASFLCAAVPMAAHADWTLSTRALNPGGTITVGAAAQTAATGTVTKTFANGASVAVAVTPAAGYSINTIKVNGALVGSVPASFTGVDKDAKGLVVSFKATAASLTALTIKADLGGKASPSGLFKAKPGSTATVTFLPSGGNTFAGITGATALTSVAVPGGGTKVTFTVPAVATTVTGNFTGSFQNFTTPYVNSKPFDAMVQCVSCHNGAGVGVVAGVNVPYNEWNTSAHKPLNVTCASCHTGANAGAHPGTVAVNTCQQCHSFSSLPTAAATHSGLHPTIASNPDCSSCHDGIASDLATSQHGTRQGKATWYSDNLNNPEATELQKGFGNYVNVAYAALPCGKCHNAAAWTVGGVDTWPGLTNGGKMVCNDCHGNKVAGADTTKVNAPVTKTTCFGCHSRQANEASAGLTDVHFLAGMGCSSCHSTADMHGTGTQTASQLQWGTISAQCENCHGAGKSKGEINMTIPEHSQHISKIACSTCHAESMITCHNCHFDNEAGAGGAAKAKFFSGKFGGTVASGNSWRYLVNRVMPDGSTKVYPGSMQSLAADYTVDNVDGGETHTHAGIAPYYSHTITRVNALTCDKCHGTQNSVQLAAGQPVRVTTWNAAAGVAIPAASVAATFTGPKGVIPVPENPRGKLLMDFVDLTNPALGATSPRVLLQKDGPDTIHMMEAYVRPMTAAQMQALAMPYKADAITAIDAHSTAKIGTNQMTEHTSCGSCHKGVFSMFSTSQHGTRQGKDSWYSDNLANPAATELQKGFGNYVNVAYAALPCGKCHNAAAWTPPAGTDQWLASTGGKSVCTDCHGNKAAGADTTSVYAPVTKTTCFGCHSRQANEASAGLTDVHFVAGMVCTSCHSTTDLHGTGTQTASQLQWGTISAQCENCHGAGTSRPMNNTIPEHNQHVADIACSTCHAESMITCHNCHFDNEAGAGGALKAKFFSGKFGGTTASGNSWRYLVNRVMPDGSTKVYPGSMQSLVADYTTDNVDNGVGHTHAGIAPYYSHAITKVNALRCDKCHGTPNAISLNGGTPVRVTTWNAAAGVPVAAGSVAATFTGPKGVIPVPENPRGKLLMDFVDLVNPAAGTASDRILFQKDGPDTIHMMEKYVRPMTAGQIQKLATPQVRP